MNKDASIYVAGHRGLVGSAILRRLEELGYANVVTRPRSALNLTRQSEVEGFFASVRPDAVFLAAAKVGGILANDTYPADFIKENLLIQTHIMDAALQTGVKKLLFLGSSCIYPKHCPQPMREDHLMTGPLEPTNSPYAVAKIAGIEMCWATNRQHGTCFLPVMPTNLYGPNDNFDLTTSHVLPALIRKFHLASLAVRGDRASIERDAAVFGPIPADFLEAISGDFDSVTVTLWGTGAPKREFLHADDLAAACVYLMTDPATERAVRKAPFLINIGTGRDATIRELAERVARIVGYDGEVVWDHTKPDGTPRKLLDVSRLTDLGWRPAIGLDEGIRKTYDWYVNTLKG